MFIKITEKDKKEDKNWKVSIIECKEVHYIPIEKSDELTKPSELLNITGYIHLEPNGRKITLWKNKICHVYLLNLKGKTIDKLN